MTPKDSSSHPAPDEKALFLDALEIQDPGERAAWLEKACAGDQVLQARVRELLRAAMEDEDEFLDPRQERLNEAFSILKRELLAEKERSGDPEDDRQAPPVPPAAPASPRRGGGMDRYKELEKIGEGGGDQDDSVPSAAELAHDFPELEIIELIGRGGMGAVFKARQASLDRFVALKVLPDEWSTTGSFRERFEREAKTLASLNHPNIVTIHEFGERHGRFYFTMEYVDGTDLAHMIRGKELEPALALELIPQICEAMQFAHEHDVVHRDIKPGNILVGRDGRVKVADFGLAKLGKLNAQLEPGPEQSASEAQSPELTDPRGVLGTPLYMAPEQATAASTVDHRADLYALGKVFYEMLVGSPPADGELMIPPSRKGKVDRRWDRVILRALEQDPERRYQNASEIKTAVESVMAEKQWVPRWVKKAGVAALLAVTAGSLFFLARNKPSSDELLTNSLGMQFAPVPGVEGLTSIWETRVRDYQAFVTDTGRGWPSPIFEQTPDHPAVHVSWHDARAFCRWLTEREHASGNLPANEVYRLPTDREWSAMAHLGNEEGATLAERHGAQLTIYPWGEEALVPDKAGNYPDLTARDQLASAMVADYDDGFAATAPVGRFRSTSEGLHDLGGNVWEWTETKLADDDPRPVLRGGGWWAFVADDGWQSLLASHRRTDLSASTNDQWDVGFRVVRGPELTDTGEPDLFHLILNGDLGAVEAALAAGLDANTSNAAGQPPIVLAAECGNLGMVQLLHRSGGKTNASDRRGRTPLHAAAELGHTEMTAWLLDQGADARAKTIAREEPLLLAMDRAPLALLELLLAAAGPDSLIATDAAGDAPLLKACMTGCPDETIGWVIGKLTAQQIREATEGDLSGWLTPLVARDSSFLRAFLAKTASPLSPDQILTSLLSAIQLNKEEHFTLMTEAMGGAPLSPPQLVFLAHSAAGTGRPWAVKKLLSMDWTLKTTGSDGETVNPLHSVSSTSKTGMKNGVLSMLEGKITKPEDQARMVKVFTELLAKIPPPATRETIRVLVEAGADIEDRNSDEETPLGEAAMSGNLAAVETLLDLGADTEASDNLGFTPLLSAVEAGHLEIVKALERGKADFGATTKAGRGALHLPRTGDEAMMSYLLSKKLPLEARGRMGATPLLVHAGMGRVEMVALLLQAGADINASAETGSSAGATALFSACLIADVEDARRTHQSGETLGEIRTSFTPPESREDRLRCVQLLMKHDADPRATNARGWNALHAAAASGFHEAVEILLEDAKIDPNTLTAKLSPPLQLAIVGGHLECARALIARGAVVDSPLWTIPFVNIAVTGGNSELVSFLVDHGAPIDLSDPYGALPIHHAAYEGRTKIIEILHAAGADLGVTDRSYRTPLHQAAAAGHREASDRLCELGADPRLKDINSRTPAQLAALAGHPALAAHLQKLEKNHVVPPGTEK